MEQSLSDTKSMAQFESGSGIQNDEKKNTHLKKLLKYYITIVSI